MTTVSGSTAATTTSTAAAAATTASTSSSTASTDSDSIDWNALVEAAVQAKLDKADSIDLKITSNETKIAAYTEAQTLLSALETAAQALRAPSGSSNADDNVFLDRTAYLTANGSVDASSSVSVTTESGALLGSHDLQILQLAKTHKVAGTAVDSKTTDLGYAGVIRLGTVDGDTADITISADMTLAEIAEAINYQTSTTGVQASVLKISDSQYELVFTTSETGQSISASAVSGGDVLNALGITDADGAFADELQASQQAILKIDGVQVTRGTNDIDDIFDGMTFHLYQVTPDETSITVDIGNDLSTVKTAIQSLVDAYNALRDFVVTQQGLTSTGAVADDAVLFGDGTLRNITQAVYEALTTSVNEASLSTLGLSFDESNHLVLDEDTLDNALLDDLDSVEALLEFKMTSSSSDLLLLARGTDAPSSFTIDVTVDSDGALTSASIDGDASMFTISNSSIIGKAGTAYEGYTFVYTGKTSQSIDVTTSAGIAELLHTAADAAADSTDGTLQGLIDNLEESDTRLQAKSDEIRSRAETYRTNLTARYAKYQAAIESAESMKSYLEALLEVQTSS